MKRLMIRSCLAIGLLTLPSLVAAVPAAYDRPRYRLDATLLAGLASSDRTLSDEGGQGIGQAQLRFSQAFAPGLYIRGEADIADRDTHGGEDPVVLRDLFLHYADGPVDVRFGLQTIAWARTDVLNPLDVVTPFRYRWLTYSDADQRVGSVALRVSRNFGGVKATVVALPLFRPSTVPLGPTGDVPVRESSPEEPLGAFGARAEWSSGSFEIAASVLRHRSLRPSLAPEAIAGDGIGIVLRHPVETVAGADFAYSAGSVIWRAESAWTTTEDCCEFAGAQFTKRDNAFVVAGFEIAPWSGWRWVTQAFHKHNRENADSQLLARDNPLRALAIGNDLLNEELRDDYTGLSVGIYPGEALRRLSLQGDAAWITQTGDLVVRPRLSWRITDAVSLRAGADLYDGNRRGPLGRLQDNSTVFLTMVYAGQLSW